MIQILQRKFIITAMLAISILLLVVLGAVNGGNFWIVERQSDQLLKMLSEEEGMVPPEKKYGEKGPGKFFPPVTEDTAMTASFFRVHVSQSGVLEDADVSQIASVTEEEALDLAREVWDKGENTGKIGSFRYRKTISRDGKGSVLVFLETSNQIRMIWNVLGISAAAGILCWCLMLLMVVLLSKRAILPIAINIEKQKQFVTDAGHEIKTPLAIILANTDALELHMGESRWSRNIRSQTQRLGGLMQNLLTLSKMEESQGKLILRDCSLSQLLEETLTAFSELAKARGIGWKAEIQPSVTVQGDRESLQQLLSILLENGIKYADEGTEIEVNLKQHERAVLLQVKNFCGQLPETEPERLFDRFYRGDSARTQKGGGYGIGLSVARAIVRSHKGSISAKYEDGNAILFTVRL